MLAATILYNVFMAVVVATAAFLLKRRQTLLWFIAGSVIVVLAAAAVATVLAVGIGRGPFASANLLSYGLFVHYVIFAAACGTIWWRTSRKSSLLAWACAIVAAGIGIDAFFIEPYWLVVTEHNVRTDKTKLDHGFKIAVLADIQTDYVGRYERWMLERLREEKPSMILLAGDYVQVETEEEWVEQRDRLRKLFQKNLADIAPMGIYAVQGNVDRLVWREIFADTAVQTFPNTRSIDVASEQYWPQDARRDVRVTCLSEDDSFDINTRVEGTDHFHIVLGHAPNFALGNVDADLLVAGHTHGGQVQMPFFGPFITLSRVQRSWAHGLTKLSESKNLVVSRGIGMERGDAPRLRFLCRPEIVIINVANGEKDCGNGRENRGRSFWSWLF